MTHRIRRRGFTMALVLLCLILVSILGMLQIRLMFESYRIERLRKNQVMAAGIASAGIDRGRRLLETSPAYTGETWYIPADDLFGTHSGEVEIAIQNLDSNEAVITVTAHYPVESRLGVTVRSSKQITFSKN